MDVIRVKVVKATLGSSLLLICFYWLIFIVVGDLNYPPEPDWVADGTLGNRTRASAAPDGC